MRTITKAAFALVAALAAGQVATAQAQDALSYPRVVGSGENASVEYGSAGSANIIGGGVASMVGSGENASVVYDGPVQAQHPLYAYAIGTGEQTQIVYSEAPDRNVALAEAGFAIPSANQGSSLLATLFGGRG
jgi:hypothetical protein